MNQLHTTAIILSRTDYGEADRILTLLTPDHGKLRLIAKGVRRVRSKLAGGIELFSVSQVSFIRGRGELGTLVSTRLLKYYSHIVQDVGRTMLGYDLIKQLNRVTEDQPEAAYFELLEQGFAALDDLAIDLALLRVWFLMQLLRLGGHTPNLRTDTSGSRLAAEAEYDFDFDNMAFFSRVSGHFTADHIKFLRLGFSGSQPRLMQQVTGLETLIAAVAPLVQTMAQTHLRL